MEIAKDVLNRQIALAKGGHQGAFNFILITFWSEVYGFQLKRTQNTHDAEDITIQTFSKAFDKIASYKEEFKFSTWLMTISKNIHRDILRKKKNSIQTESSKNLRDRVFNFADAALGPEDALIREQDRALLLKHINLLKPHYQEMISFRYFQEMSYREISEKLGEPMTNVKVKLFRARTLLFKIIQKAQV